MRANNGFYLAGRLGNDPELRTTTNGNQITTMSMAVDRPVKGRDGSWTREAEWFRITLFGERFATLGSRLKKGAHVTVAGQLRVSKWTDKEGQKRERIEFIADDVAIGSWGRSDDDNGGNGGNGGQHGGGRGGDQQRHGDGYGEGGQHGGEQMPYQDEEIPF